MENFKTANRLATLGFAFNPFEHLEASSDPYLQEYLVSHDIFSVVWDDSPAFLFAPPGGGKTAMRIYTFRSCWLESGRNNKFPIPYYLPHYFDNSDFGSLEDHLMGITQAGASALLLSVAYRPFLFWGLNHSQQLRLFQFIQHYLPADLFNLLERLEESGSPISVTKTLDQSFTLPNPPSQEEIVKLCKEIKKLDIRSEAGRNFTPYERIDQFGEIIFSDLGFRSAFVLLDGIDGFPNLGEDSAKATMALNPLLDYSNELAKQRIMIKSFLPTDLYLSLQSHRYFAGNFLNAVLEWNVPSLAELLRRRVYVATQGYFGSLDAISSIGIRDIELALAKVVLPLPREAILISRHLLDEVVSHPEKNYLDVSDLEGTLAWYQDVQFSIAASIMPNRILPS